jgi:hypothetical protein
MYSNKPATPLAAMNLSRTDARNLQEAKDWMCEHARDYETAAALAQDAAIKYDLAANWLLRSAEIIKGGN